VLFHYSNVAINPTVDWKGGIAREKCGVRGWAYYNNLGGWRGRGKR